MDGELIIIPFQSCCLCRGPGERFRMNTAYTNDELNYSIACDICQKVIQEQWNDEWRDYYGSRL